MVKTEIPQGTILGPILFLIYVNDLPSIISNAYLSLHADESSIAAFGNTCTPKEAETALNTCLNHVQY